MSKSEEQHFEGKGCKCAARCSGDCACEDADWTPKEVYELRKEIVIKDKRIVKLELKNGQLKDELSSAFKTKDMYLRASGDEKDQRIVELEAELFDEKKDRALLSKATDKINDLEAVIGRTRESIASLDWRNFKEMGEELTEDEKTLLTAYFNRAKSELRSPAPQGEYNSKEKLLLSALEKVAEAAYEYWKSNGYLNAPGHKLSEALNRLEIVRENVKD